MAQPIHTLSKLQRRSVAILVLTVLIIFLVRFFTKNRKTQKPVPAPVEYTPPDNREIIPAPRGSIALPDSTKVYFLGGVGLKPSPQYKKRREVEVDGDMFFEVPEASRPLMVHSRLLTLTVVGKAAFRITANRKEDGEEVQVISGNIRVKKAYKSQFSEPDTLHDNQMIMINISIDLMEKEKMDTRDLRAWRDSILTR